MKTAIIIGAGLGGLCTSVRLLNKGYKTIILEKENSIGGKTNRKTYKDFKFDLTASIIMTPDIYKGIYEDVGKDFNDYIKLSKLDNTYRVNYYDNTYYDFYYDTNKMINTLENIEKGLSVEYFDFLSNSFKKYLLSKNYLLDKPMIYLKEILNFKSLKKLISINPSTKAFKYIDRKISNEKLRDFLIFQSMYIGVNPYTNSNIFTLIPAISQLYGISYIEGGLYSYILGLEKLINELGGKIELDHEVDEILIENGKVVGVISKGTRFYSDIVICNADYPYAIENLIKEDVGEIRYKKNNIKGCELSPSVFIIYLGLDKKYDELKVHNIYINKEFKESIESAFEGKMPLNPSLYIYYPSAVDNTLSKTNESVLNIMLRVPNLKNNDIKWNEKYIKQIRNEIMKCVKNMKTLEDIEEHIVYEDYLTPLNLQNDYNTYYGNAFGLSHTLTQSIYLRPHIKSKKINGLYFINSSTHPGNGASVVIDGTKILCNVIEKDFNKKSGEF